MPTQTRPERGFTLIELMMVIAIMMVILAIGAPAVLKAVNKNPLSQAVSDVTGGMLQARASAILTGITTEFVIADSGERLFVRKSASVSSGEGGWDDDALARDPDDLNPTGEGVKFSAQLDSTVAIEVLKVNLFDYVEGVRTDAAWIRFFPNGMCDELTMVLLWASPRGIKKRLITLNPMTGISDTEVIE